MIDLVSENVDSSLRAKLAQITGQEKIDDHPKLIKKLRTEHPHTIELGTDESVPTDLRMYNCFIHALGLVDAGIIRVASAVPDTISDTQFVSYLIEQRLKEIDGGSARSGDIVIYFDGQEIKHAGRVSGDFVISKWGDGHLWKHRLFEVPCIYGDHARFFKRIERSEVEQAFLKHVKSRYGQSIVDELLAP